MVFNFFIVLVSLGILGCHIWNILLFTHVIIYKNVFESFNEYSFSLIFLNIFIYIIILLNTFLIFFLFDTKWLKTLNELKLINNLQMISMFVIISLLSFAGIPPLAGFLSKFLIFIHIFFKNNVVMFIFFLIANLFIIYFYIQNLRFMVSKYISNIFMIKNYFAYFNKSSLLNINIINFSNLSCIFFLEELILYFNLISSYIFF